MKYYCSREREVGSRVKEEQGKEKPQAPLHVVRLPGFISDEDIGLGDLIKRATSYIGIPPCSGCERRAEALNRWVGFNRYP